MLKILEPFLMLGLLIGLGGYLYVAKILDLDFCRRLSRLVIRVTFPAMIFVSMYTNIELQSLSQGWLFTLLGFGTSIFLAFTAHFSGRRLGLKDMTHGTYQILCTNGNNIFLPVPIISVLFGVEYVVYALLFELGAGLFYWSYGVSNLRQGPKFSLKRLLNLNMLALLLGLAFGLLGLKIPDHIYGALQIAGNVTLGSAMFILGALVISLLEKREKLRPEVWGVTIHRLVLSPLVGMLFLSLVQFPPELKVILLLMMSMPPLITTALVAASFNADEELAAMGVVIPTLLSFILIPAFLLLF